MPSGRKSTINSFNDGESLHALLANILPHRDIQRTLDWVEPREGVANRGSRTEDLSAQAALLELEARTEKTIDPEALAPRPQKVKTRGEAAPSEPPQAQPPEEPAQPPKYTFSKRGLKVFSTLFYSPSGGDPPGKLPWSEFLSVMASVGFLIHKLDGSAWVFEPLSDLFRRSIIFHEPHPINKIPFQTARRYGRRLEGAYG